MKKIARILTSIVMTCGVMLAFASTASAKLPADMNEYKTMYESEAATPEGAAKLWLSAAFLYSDSATRDLGRQMLIHIMKGLPKDFEKNSAHATMVNRLKTEPQTQRSFCAGATPENGYKADLENCEVTVTGTREGAGDSVSVFLKSSGADSPRMVTVVKAEDGKHWIVMQPAGLYMGIKPAVKK